MKFIEVLTNIMGEVPQFGGDNHPYKILEKINEGSTQPIIDYSNFYLYKDQKTAKIWFNNLFNRYYEKECINLDDLNYSLNIKMFNFIYSLFSKYEEIYQKYKLLFDFYNDEDFKNKILSDKVELTQSHQTEDYLMPQENEQDDTINNKHKSNTSTITNYNNNYFNKINNISNNLSNFMSKWLDEFDSFFYDDWGYY